MTSDWTGQEYSTAAEHHREFDDWFLERLRPKPTDVVVDVGSGSGEFTAQIAELASEGTVTGVEPDPSMLEAARRHVEPNLRFVQGSAEELDRIIDPSSVDLVISRAVLHWIPLERYPRVFEAAYDVLRPGGWFHSESAAAGNGAKMIEFVNRLADKFGVPPPEAFPDPGTVFDIVEQAGYMIPMEGVRSVVQRRSFGAEQISSFVKTQVAVLLTRGVDAELSADIVDEALRSVDELRRPDGTFDQTFVRLEVLAQRPAR